MRAKATSTWGVGARLPLGPADTARVCLVLQALPFARHRVFQHHARLQLCGPGMLLCRAMVCHAHELTHCAGPPSPVPQVPQVLPWLLRGHHAQESCARAVDVLRVQGGLARWCGAARRARSLTPFRARGMAWRVSWGTGGRDRGPWRRRRHIQRASWGRRQCGRQRERCSPAFPTDGCHAHGCRHCGFFWAGAQPNSRGPHGHPTQQQAKAGGVPRCGTNPAKNGAAQAWHTTWSRRPHRRHVECSVCRGCCSAIRGPTARAFAQWRGKLAEAVGCS